jgi:hypothetical protein
VWDEAINALRMGATGTTSKANALEQQGQQL